VRSHQFIDSFFTGLLAVARIKPRARGSASTVTRLCALLLKHDGKSELLFVNRRGRPFSANKLRGKQPHPLLETHIAKHAAKLCALAGVSIAHHKKHSFHVAAVHIPASDPHAT